MSVRKTGTTLIRVSTVMGTLYTATIICCHIIDDGKPILYVSHDEDDGMWQFLCGSTHDTDEARLVSLKEAFDLDNSVGVLKDMPCGYYAERKTQDDNWLVKKR